MTMLRLNNLKSPKGSHKNIKRLGRGQGSGQGTQAGKGHKGQKARTGGGVRFGFEGGSMPFYMRIPKSGTFTNAKFKKLYAVVNLSQITEKYCDNEIVSKETLIDKGLIKGLKRRWLVKILADGPITKVVTFSNIDKFSKAAIENIQKAGGIIKK